MVLGIWKQNSEIREEGMRPKQLQCMARCIDVNGLFSMTFWYSMRDIVCCPGEEGKSGETSGGVAEINMMGSWTRRHNGRDRDDVMETAGLE